MRICFQDPKYQTYCLHEELLLASIGSTFGAAAFAFVTKGGLELLVENSCCLLAQMK
jgi:hypothetical protein